MGGTTTTKQETKSDPWAAAQPALKSLLSNSEQLYNSGQGFNPYPGSTVAPLSGQTNQALQGMQAIAGQGDPTGQAAYGNAQNVIQSGGMNPAQWNSLQGTYGVATGQNGINTGGQYQGLFNQAGQPGAVQQNLSGYASGANLNNGSAQFNSMLDRQSGAMADDINRGFSNMGRYGSTSHQGELGSQIGNFRNDAMAGELQRQQGMQMQAAGMMSGEQNQGFANQYNALGGATGVQGQNIGNMMNAGQGFTGAVNQGQQLAGQYSGMAPGLYDQLYSPSKMLGQVGSAYDAQNQAQLSDQVNRWTQQQQAPWNRLSAMGNVALGAGGMGGTSSGTTSTTQPFNPLQAIGGIGASVLPFFSGGVGGAVGSPSGYGGIIGASSPPALNSWSQSIWG